MATKRDKGMLAILTTLLIVGVALWVWIGGDWSQGKQNSLGPNSSSKVAATSNDQDLKTAGKGPPGMLPSPVASSAATNDDKSKAGSGLARYVTIRVLSPDGLALPGVKFELRTLSARESILEQAETDSSGVFGRAVVGPATLKVTSDDDRWLFTAVVHATVDRKVVDCTAWPVGEIDITAVLEDGTPFPGRALVRTGEQVTKQPKPGSPLGFTWAGGSLQYCQPLRFDRETTVRLTRVPIGLDLQIAFPAVVIGYDEQWIVIKRDRVVHGRSLLVTLVSNPGSKGGIVEFDPAGLEGKGLVAEITLPGSKVIFGGGHLSPPEIWRSNLQYPGEYVLRVRGAMVWESEVFRVEPRRVTRVVYAPLSVVAVRVLVVDESRRPLEGALLTRDYLVYPSFENSKEPGPNATTSIADGSATLRAVPTGKRKLLVAARGYEPRLLELDLTPGVDLDAGEIVLQPATGKIVIHLSGMKDDQKYSILVLQPGGSVVRSMRDVTSATLTLNALPCRKYCVAAIVGKGGSIASQMVELTIEQPALEITLDVSTLMEQSLSQPK